jgi:hypothetical protein
VLQRTAPRQPRRGVLARRGPDVNHGDLSVCRFTRGGAAMTKVFGPSPPSDRHPPHLPRRGLHRTDADRGHRRQSGKNRRGSVDLSTDLARSSREPVGREEAAQASVAKQPEDLTGVMIAFTLRSSGGQSCTGRPAIARVATSIGPACDAQGSRALGRGDQRPTAKRSWTTPPPRGLESSSCTSLYR